MLALGSKLRRDLLAYFYGNRRARVYVRQLAERIGADSTNVSRELARLEQYGLLVSEREGRQLYYRLNLQNRQVRPLFQLLQQTIGAEPILRKSLAHVSGLSHAWIYGSFAKGGADANSDLDLLLVGRPDQQQLAAALRRVEESLNRQINYTVLTLPELERRLAEQDPFLTDIWNGRRISLIGATEDSHAAT
jgi:predicted nucleotidyltransferase